MIDSSSSAPVGHPAVEPFGSGAPEDTDAGAPSPASVASAMSDADPKDSAGAANSLVGFGSTAPAEPGEGVTASSPTQPDFIPVRAPSGSGEAATATDFIPVRAMEAMLALRHEQIHRFGHTLQADRERPLQDFAHDIESLARAILEDVQFHKPDERIRKRTLKLGALCMALADRLEGD